MVNFDPMTYKKLIEKYPAMKNDIEQLQEDKNVGVQYNRIFFFVLGVMTTVIIYWIKGGI